MTRYALKFHIKYKLTLKVGHTYLGVNGGKFFMLWYDDMIKSWMKKQKGDTKSKVNKTVDQ